MKSLRLFLILLFMLGGLARLSPVWATAAPAAQVRYVSPTGTDTGDCANPGMPCATLDYARIQSSPGDTLHLAAGTYVENVNLFTNLTIRGAGPGQTIVDGNQDGRVFTIINGHVHLENLTVQNGNEVDNLVGGGIYNASHLTLQNVVVQNNQAADYGGGIYNAGTLTVTQSLIQNNAAANSAGGLANFGSGLLGDSTISNNTVTEILGNAGGILNNFGASIALDNVTLSGNTAASGGGLSNSGDALLFHTTLANNQATNNFGSGISNYGQVTIRHTLIADNLGGSQCQGAGTFTSQGYNLESGNSCNLNQSGDLTGAAANLQPLGDYGGPTPTHALQPSSPAIDAALDGCLDNDQRGFPRPVDGDGDNTPGCDIGAFEFNPATDLPKVFLPIITR